MAFLLFKSSIAAPRFEYHGGDLVQWPDDDVGRGEVERFCERGIAEELTEAKARLQADMQNKSVKVHTRALERPPVAPARTKK